MPKVYKVKEQAPDGSYILHHSSADIISFDASSVPNLDTNNVQDAIRLVNDKTEANATTITLMATIHASDFTGDKAPYIATISVDGILESDNPMIGAIYNSDPSTNMLRQESWAQVQRITCTDGSITIYCYEDKPLYDIPIQLKIVR